MTGATICSGIGAPETARPDIEWKWCSEVDAACCAVLAQKYPHSVNLGDMTAEDFTERALAITPELDLLVAGTPCQAFSIAGNRLSLADDRGNLTLRLVEIVHAIKPKYLLWENVPGVLNTHDNAFGCFLGGLVGSSEAIPPERGKRHPGAGVVAGPKGTVCWRVLDAQHQRVAQRRRRVFVIFGSGERISPGEVLLEWEGLRRNSPPRREAREGIAADAEGRAGCGGERWGYETSPPLTNSGRGVERAGGSRGQDCVVAVESGNGYCSESDTAATALVASTGETSHCLNAGGMGRIDYETETLVTHSLRADGFDASEDGTGRGTPLVVGSFEQNSMAGRGTLGWSDDDVLRPVKPQSDHQMIVTAFSGMAQSGAGWAPPSCPSADGVALPLDATRSQAIAFTCKDHGSDAGETAPTLRAMEFDGSHANGGGQVAVVYDTTQVTSVANRSNPQPGDPSHPLAAGAHPPLAVNLRSRDGGAQAVTSDVASPQSASGGYGRSFVSTHAVRRLTPEECCALQAFPRNFFDGILYRGRPLADGPKYKMLGNSMCVNVVRWIIDRIESIGLHGAA